ncbi:MAG: hypothetical protein LBL34_03935 [Clostridiales bacterium]|jgi:hypothetical protein|nr:hypothetical protein [Clostridiales bacterium]
MDVSIRKNLLDIKLQADKSVKMADIPFDSPTLETIVSHFVNLVSDYAEQRGVHYDEHQISAFGMHLKEGLYDKIKNTPAEHFADKGIIFDAWGVNPDRSWTAALKAANLYGKVIPYRVKVQMWKDRIQVKTGKSPDWKPLYGNFPKLDPKR